MSATAGKVALVSSTTTLSGSCPTADPTLVDFVGFGSAANCSLGTPTATLSNTTAATRTNVCLPTNNNGADFAAGAVVPHNTASALVNCGTPGSTQLAATGFASPASTFTGVATLLKVTVVPGTGRASTGIQVAADLSAVGGSSAQTFFDDGTNGDVTAGDNVFSYSLTPTAVGALRCR